MQGHKVREKYFVTQTYLTHKAKNLGDMRPWYKQINNPNYQCVSIFWNTI